MTDTTRVLVVEDQMMIAFNIKFILEDAGFEVVGPFESIERATSGATTGEDFDAAVLDINLGGKSTTVPYADHLVEQGIPFVFVSGYGSGAPLPKRFNNAVRLPKPISDRDLVATVGRLVQTEGDKPSP